MRKKIILTKDQESCVNFPDDKNLLVRGIAGSGKSLVILTKAVKIAKKSIETHSNKKIGIFTYINTLVSYTNEILLENEQIASKINVSTMDWELIKLYKRVTGKYVGQNQMSTTKWNIKKCNSILEQIVRDIGGNNRFLKPEMKGFLKDEITWIKQRMYTEEDQYVNCERTGRGTSVRPLKDDRKLIFQIYKKYYKSLQQSNIYDYDVMYEELYNRRNQIPADCKYTHLLIDECQDLSLNKLLLARELCTEAVVLAADFAQKIYKTGFSWKEIGFDIRGQASKKLKGTFRNTYEILALANSLVPHNNLLKNNQDEYIAPEMPTVHGEKPTLLYAKDWTAEENLAIDVAIKINKEHPDFTIAIMANLKEDIDRIASNLKKRGIEYQLIRKKENFKVLQPGIKLVNFHSSKGLEFNTVILTLLDEGKFPKISYYTAKEEIPDILDQARNLFYVAITRARNNLFMTTCKVGGRQSPLIADLDPTLYNH